MTILQELCEELCVEPDVFMRFSATAPHRYKVYDISKRNGKGTRTIAHPSKELKNVQRRLLEMLRELLPISRAAMAYQKGIGIKENAKVHVQSRYLLKMDFNNFFPSITPDLLFDVLSRRNINFTNDDVRLLRGLLFWKPVRKGGLVLSIGAPTSPLVSNSLLCGFDEKISEECVENSVFYTRYADDLTFSTNEKGGLFKFPELIQGVLNDEFLGKITINHEKTVYSSKAHNRHVTGITLTNDSLLSIGRERKRNISAAVHHYLKGSLKEEEIASLQGKVSFARHIEPDFFERLEKKYGKNAISKLMSHKNAGC